MTREEAIYCLKSYQPDAPDDMCQKCKYYKSVKLAPNVYTCISDKAREMAIQALSQEPCDDAISRQDAIDAIYEHEFSNWCDKDEVSTILNDLPSVTSKYIECEDAISRKAVFNAIEREDKWLLAAKGHNGLTEMAFSGLKARIDALLPVTQKSGKWIPVSESPKELGTYLIQTDGEPYMCQCRWTDVNPFWTDLKTKPHWNIFDLPQYSKVVAWMPLPKPYEPRESEE